jgi:hypothetical protein
LETFDIYGRKWQLVYPNFSTQLSALTARQSESDTPVILDNGLLLPPIGMYKIPRVTSFEPAPLPPHLEPRRDKNSRHHKKDSGVFFFTPIQFGGKTGDPNMMAFKWVEGDVAEVCLTIFNPLPIEVKIVNLALLHEVNYLLGTFCGKMVGGELGYENL